MTLHVHRWHCQYGDIFKCRLDGQKCATNVFVFLQMAAYSHSAILDVKMICTGGWKLPYGAH